MTGITTLDELILKAKSITNDPSSVAYLTAAFTVAMDYSRIMASQGQSAAQVTEGAREEAVRIVKAGFDDDARQALIGVLESDTQGQMKGVQDQLSAIVKRITKGAPKAAPSGSWTDKDEARLQELEAKHGAK